MVLNFSCFLQYPEVLCEAADRSFQGVNKKSQVDNHVEISHAGTTSGLITTAQYFSLSKAFITSNTEPNHTR